MTQEERLPWFPCQQEKLLAALAQMQPAEGYVYCIMLLRIYDCGGACPDDIEAIATRTRFNRRVVADALDRLFKADRLRREPDGIHNPKADEVIKSAKRLRQERKTAGRDGGLRSAKKREQNQRSRPSKASILLEQTGGKIEASVNHAGVSVSSSLSEDSLFRGLEESTNKKESRDSIDWNFDEFWKPYPNKVAKDAARTAFVRVQKSSRVTFADLMAGWRCYIAKTDDRPWCNPATWLNQGRWEDQPATNGEQNGANRSGGNASGNSRGGFASLALKRSREASGA